MDFKDYQALLQTEKKTGQQFSQASKDAIGEKVKALQDLAIQHKAMLDNHSDQMNSMVADHQKAMNAMVEEHKSMCGLQAKAITSVADDLSNITGSQAYTGNDPGSQAQAANGKSIEPSLTLDTKTQPIPTTEDPADLANFQAFLMGRMTS